MQVRFHCPPELADVIPQPVLATRGLPDWLKEMPLSALSAEFGTEMDTVKHCPPFLDAMGCGFHIPLVCDISVRGGAFEWHWDLPDTALRDGMNTRSPFSFHTSAQASGTPLHDPSRFFIKFNNFWAIELEPGWSLLITHPFNRSELPFQTLTGLVDCDSYSRSFVNFPAVWLDPDYEGVIAKGTPVAQCVPVKRQPLEFAFETLTDDAAQAYADTKAAVHDGKAGYRRHFRSTKK